MNDRRALSNPAAPNCTDAALPDTPALRSDRLYRLRKFGYLWKVAAQALRNGVPLRDYARMATPLFLRGTSRLPHALYLEFSNVCNTVCEYCPYPAYAKTLPFMRRDVFTRILDALSEVPVNKIHVGGGEPTLHPHFSAWLPELRGSARFVNVVSNGQWSDDAIAETLMSGAADMVEISVDAGGKYAYEAARSGASHDRLMRNLSRLRQIKRSRASQTIIGIRLMIRPSTRSREREHLRAWSPHCDVIFAQYVSKPAGSRNDADMYVSSHELHATYPRCSSPSRALQIKADGTVPLCGINGHSPQDAAIILGNILDSRIHALWNDPRLAQYREAHRTRSEALMPACRGCAGA